MPEYKPKEQNSLTCMLAVNDAQKAIEWYEKVLGAKEIFRLVEPDGKIVHAELKIDDSMISIAEHQSPYNETPHMLGGSPVILTLNVPDVDAIYARAVENGAITVYELKDQFYGYRSGRVVDPIGHIWILSTMKSEMSPEEMQRKMDELMG